MTETEHAGGAADDQADIRICTSCGRVHTERECEQRETSDRSDEAVEEPLAGAAPTRLLPRGAELHTG